MCFNFWSLAQSLEPSQCIRNRPDPKDKGWTQGVGRTIPGLRHRVGPPLEKSLSLPIFREEELIRVAQAGRRGRSGVQLGFNGKHTAFPVGNLELDHV